MKGEHETIAIFKKAQINQRKKCTDLPQAAEQHKMFLNQQEWPRPEEKGKLK